MSEKSKAHQDLSISEIYSTLQNLKQINDIHINWIDWAMLGL